MSGFRPTTLAASLALVLVAVMTSTGTVRAALPPCLNYSHAEEGGHIEIDLRFDPRTQGYSTLTIFLFVNDPGAAPGTYVWNIVLNGAPQQTHFEIKDNNLHTVSRMNQDHWVFGDTFRFQATHYSPATHKSYVAAYNECVITRR